MVLRTIDKYTANAYEGILELPIRRREGIDSHGNDQSISSKMNTICSDTLEVEGVLEEGTFGIDSSGSEEDPSVEIRRSDCSNRVIRSDIFPDVDNPRILHSCFNSASFILRKFMVKFGLILLATSID